jgi:uracil-DNA glycosylase family 4
MSWLTILNREVVACTRCPRLVEYREQVAREKRRAYRDLEYWGKPVPGFGDPQARVLIMGLAPGAHGSNRTGRMFTGDSSGKFLYPVLHETGFASQPTATDRNDGLKLKDLYITAAVRCAPPKNKPLPQELAECSQFLDRELAGLVNVRVVVALGKIGFDAYLNHLQRHFAHTFDKLRAGFGTRLIGGLPEEGSEPQGLKPASLLSSNGTLRLAALAQGRLSAGSRALPKRIYETYSNVRKNAPPRQAQGKLLDGGSQFSKRDYIFKHGAGYRMPDGKVLLASYHPSNQNTQTGKLTRRMLVEIFKRAAKLADEAS